LHCKNALENKTKQYRKVGIFTLLGIGELLNQVKGSCILG
jgi:hypothetical protein